MSAAQIDRNLIAAVLGRLGSDFDGEVLAAARQAERLRREAGATWYDLILPVLPPPDRPSQTRRRAGRWNRAQRRAAIAEQKRRMRQMGREAQGLWAGELIRPNTLNSLEAYALVTNWLIALHRAEGRQPPLCLTCETSFHPHHLPAAFFCIRPAGSATAAFGSVSGLCNQCAARPDKEVEQLALAALRKGFLPDLRELPAANFRPDWEGRA